MSDYEKLYDFKNLYKAHKAARKGKRDMTEVITFEMNLAKNLTELSEAIKNKTYQINGYYSFFVHDPKKRKIHALHYIDRVVQHCLCDEILVPILDKKLIYDNAACRIGKGTHFALERVNSFLRSYYKNYGDEGFFLKCDIRKFFDSIDHCILKEKMKKVINEEDVLWILNLIIDSFETAPGKGLPMGNQTSQWFAIFYLDGFDRLIKEKLQIKYYSRYMDDCVLIHHDKEYLKLCRCKLENYINNNLRLDFNSKTQIFPLKNGVDYLGFHFYVSQGGKVIRKVRQQTKKKYKRKIKYLEYAYLNGFVETEEIKQILSSYRAHFSYGHTYKMQKKILNGFVLRKD